MFAGLGFLIYLIGIDFLGKIELNCLASAVEGKLYRCNEVDAWE